MGPGQDESPVWKKKQCLKTLEIYSINLTFVSCSHLDCNNLTEVNSGSLYGLTSLQQLYLSNNSIARINPDGWKFCHKLREL